MNIDQIKQLVEKFPNNMELGNAVRKLYWKATEEEVAEMDSAELPDDLVWVNKKDLDG
jgi:hypothetical protein